MTDHTPLGPLPEPAYRTNFGAGLQAYSAAQMRAYALQERAASLSAGWMPIESAPRDGSEVVYWSEAGAASEQRWIDWLVQHGLLHFYTGCKRPDGSFGPAWVLRTPAVVNGDSCEAWHSETAAGALRAFLRGAQDQG
jgi:hypothetical protein